MNLDLSHLYLKRKAVSRSLSAENPTGEKGMGARDDPNSEAPARELGVGWKAHPCLTLKAGETAAYWYQTLPHATLPPLPDRNAREIV